MRRKADGQFGALKVLRDEHVDNSERRQRMANEVVALQRLDVHGVPRVLEHNMERVQQKEASLYLIEEWIEGKTFLQLPGDAPLHLDEALRITQRVAEILERCHEVGVLHRDIKPDNILLRQQDRFPFLVDFGIAYTQPEDPDAGTPLTGVGQELGNRFFRIPDFAPGRLKRDQRSDVTMLVGVLFFLLTGKYPRVIADERGLPPHEARADLFPKEAVEDPRWNRVIRIFQVGFQASIDYRFQSARQFREALEDAQRPSAELSPLLAQAVEALRTLLTSRAAEEAKKRTQAIETASDALFAELQRLVNQHGFRYQRGGLNRAVPGKLQEFLIGFGIEGMPKPTVLLVHSVEVADGAATLRYRLDNEPACEYFKWPAADIARLREEMLRHAESMFAEAVEVLRRKLSLDFSS